MGTTLQADPDLLGLHFLCTENPVDHNIRRAYLEGYQAMFGVEEEVPNPHLPGTSERDAWAIGRHDFRVLMER
jgi:hypothetical protein